MSEHTPGPEGQELTQEELKKHLHYDPVTGVFTRIWHPSKYHQYLVGKNAGSFHRHGYGAININNKTYSVHRLAWMYTYGEVPAYIDHINGNQADNRIENLRSVTLRENSQNRVEHRSGHIIGTSWNKKSQRWYAQIRIKGKKRFIGSFSTQQEAHEAYLAVVSEILKEGER